MTDQALDTGIEEFQRRLENMIEVYVNHEDNDVPLEWLCDQGMRIDPDGSIAVDVYDLDKKESVILSKVLLTVPEVPKFGKTDSVRREVQRIFALRVDLGSGAIDILPTTE